ncbi:MAG: hypothetical protein H0Z37_03130 [Firmicutes bacterium]|nr:hypothetical protein [Bacillota bacterium]
MKARPLTVLGFAYLVRSIILAALCTPLAFAAASHPVPPGINEPRTVEAVIDRIVDGALAVFLVGAGEYELSIPLEQIEVREAAGGDGSTALAPGTWGRLVWNLTSNEPETGSLAVVFFPDDTATLYARAQAETKLVALRAREVASTAGDPVASAGPAWTRCGGWLPPSPHDQ